MLAHPRPATVREPISLGATVDGQVLSPRYGAHSTPLDTMRTNRRPPRHRASRGRHRGRHRARPPSLRERWDRSRAKRAVTTSSKNLVRGTQRRVGRSGLSKRRVRTALADSVGIPVAYAGIALAQGQPAIAAINMLAISVVLPFNLYRGAKAERAARREGGGVRALESRIKDLEGQLNKLRPLLDRHQTPQADELAAGERERLRGRTARQPKDVPRHRSPDPGRTASTTHEPFDRGR
ncbi:MAG: hypothetical protein GEV07_07955 [Streptosporangiales bacterium]|nr:hypothetical protein [Streptosporangiales bacterium]